MSRAVIDQPGLRISAVGIVLALFFGLAIRNQISDNRINGYLSKAVQRLESEFQIDFDSAKVNLSKWGLPFPVLEIRNIRVSPKAQDCKNSQIFIDELEIPISFRLILGLSDRIPKIRMRNFEIRLDSQDRCFAGNLNERFDRLPASKNRVASNEKEEATSSIQTHNNSASNIFESRTRAELREVYVEKIKLITTALPEQPLVLKQVNFELNYDANKLSSLVVKSKLNAIKDSRSDLFYVNSDLTFLMKPVDKSVVDVVLNVEGKFLDGDVRLFAHYVSNNPKVSYEAKIGKVSTKALFPIISSEFQRSGSVIQKVPMSVSFQNSGEISLSGIQHAETTFSRILFNIESATVRSDEIKIDFTQGKFKVSPFTVLIDSLPLSRFKNSDLFTGKLDSFENLGVLSGRLLFKDEKNVSFDGILRNLEVVFSNRGRRDFQMIDEINLNLKRNDDLIFLDAHSLIVSQKKVNGIISAKYNLQNSDSAVNMRLAGVTLNRRVWEQFTFVEQDPKLDAVWNYTKTIQKENHDLKLHADNMELPGVLLSNLNFDVKQVVIPSDQESSNLTVQIKSNKLLTNQKLFENAFVSQAVDSSLGLKNQSFTSEKFNISINGKNWLNLDFVLETNLTEVQSKQPVKVNLKGSVNQKAGFNSKLLIGLKNRDYRFNLNDLTTNQISLEEGE